MLVLAPSLPLPDEPMGLAALIDDATYVNDWFALRPDWQQFEWDDTPLDCPPFDPNVDAFEVVFRSVGWVE